MISDIKELVLGFVVEFEQEPYLYGILIIILLLGIVLLILRYKGQEWAERCYEEQKKLNVYFEDQMFLLGKYIEDSKKLNNTVSQLKEILLKTESAIPTQDSISSLTEARTEVLPTPYSSVGEDTPTPDQGEFRRSNETNEQRVSAGKKLVEKSVRAFAQESHIPIREINWYTQPRMIGDAPHILMVSTGGKPKECRFSEKELAKLPADNTGLRRRLADLIFGPEHMTD